MQVLKILFSSLSTQHSSGIKITNNIRHCCINQRQNWEISCHCGVNLRHNLDLIDSNYNEAFIFAEICLKGHFSLTRSTNAHLFA